MNYLDNPDYIAKPADIKLKDPNATFARIVDRFIATKCLCDKHPAAVFVLEDDFIVVVCETRGVIWMKKPSDVALFKQHMTTIKMAGLA